MKNLLIINTDSEQLLANQNDGTNSLYINGTLINPSEYTGTGNYTATVEGHPITIRKTPDMNGNIQLIKLGTYSYALGKAAVPGQGGGGGGGTVTVDAGTTTTGLPGTSALVTNSGTTTNAIFDFVIPRGEDGEDGKGIVTAILNDDYTLTIYFTDGTSYTTPEPIRGSDGVDGSKGDQGDTGNGISSMSMNADYTLTIYFTDGTSYTTDPIRGEPGTMTSWNQVQTSGTKIADVTVNGNTIDVYVPPDTTYSAGTNVSIDANNVISAIDTTYSAGANVSISNNVISADPYTGVGNISVNAAKEISVDLSQYYTSDHVYTKDEVDVLLGGGWEFIPVDTLPAVGDSGSVYILPTADPNSSDLYIYNNGVWKKIGGTEIQLAGYVKTTGTKITYDEQVILVGRKDGTVEKMIILGIGWSKLNSDTIAVNDGYHAGSVGADTGGSRI